MKLSLNGSRAPAISRREVVPKRLLIHLVSSLLEWRGSLSRLPRPGGASNVVKIPWANLPRSSIIRHDANPRACGRAYSACLLTQGKARAPRRVHSRMLHVYRRSVPYYTDCRAQARVRNRKDCAWYYSYWPLSDTHDTKGFLIYSIYILKI